MKFVLSHSLARKRALEAVQAAQDGMVVSIDQPKRTNEQNALLWPLLHDISNTVNWYGNKLTEEEWKDVFTAALKRQKVVPGIDGGFVVIGTSTRKMGKKMFSELIDLIQAFKAQHES